MQHVGKFLTCRVNISPLPSQSEELADVIHRRCGFCEKEVEVHAPLVGLLSRLSGAGKFYCGFCLQNGLHTRNGRNVLLLSFRSVVGYFYYEHYLAPARLGRRPLTLSEVADYVACHAEVGLSNPCFRYDPEAMVWFVDFARVGTTQRKVPVEEVLKTVVNILACFNLAENVPGLAAHAFYEKYREAILAFYSRRHRPPDKRLLNPTFAGCGPVEVGKGNFDRLRAFTNKQMVLKFP